MKLKRFSLSQIFIFCALMLVDIALSITLKNEFFWDFANYHYYNAWAFLNHRLNYDIAPASVNTFFNPIIDLPLYFYIQYFNNNLSVVYAFQGIWGGLLLFAFYKIYTLFFETKNVRDYTFLILALAISVTGTATYYQLGSSTNEIPVAFFILWGLYILFKMIKFPDTQKTLRFLTAGLIMGIGLGLKQTVITYCLASGLTLIICYKYLKHPLKNILFFALGGLIGYLLIDGYFMYQKYILYGNPVFPFMNGVFHSPYFDDFNYSDKRFIPPLRLFFIYPFLWNLPQYNIAEYALTNFKLSLLYLILIILAIYIAFIKIKKHHQNFCPLFIFLFIFLALGFLTWMSLFSIMRYAVVLEVISSIIFIAILRHCILCSKTVILPSLLVSVFIVLLFSSPVNYGWDTRKPDETKFIDLENIKLPPNTLLKLYNFPSAFIIPELAKRSENLRAVGYMQYNCTYQKGSDFLEHGIFSSIRKNIEKNHNGPVIIVWLNNTFFTDINTAKIKKDVQECELQNSCAFSFCNISTQIAEMILSIPDDYFCRPLKNNIENRLTICVPNELKLQILGE